MDKHDASHFKKYLSGKIVFHQSTTIIYVLKCDIVRESPYLHYVSYSKGWLAAKVEGVTRQCEIEKSARASHRVFRTPPPQPSKLQSRKTISQFIVYTNPVTEEVCVSSLLFFSSVSSPFHFSCLLFSLFNCLSLFILFYYFSTLFFPF